MERRRAIPARLERLQPSAGVRADPSLLRALHIVYEELEQQLQRTGVGLEQVSLRRQQLERELQEAQVDLCTVDKPALHALVLAQSVRRELAGEAALVGFVQALDLAWQLRRAPARSAFESRLAAAAIPAAMSGVESLSRLLELFERPAHHRRQLLSALNFEAGMHSIPHDLREVAAALRAGEQTYREWKYYYARFGERGMRFTRSDSAWIAFVARGDAHAAEVMFDWLARLLSARGMPRLLFERHLAHLHTELVRALPDQAASYSSLLRASAKLEAERSALVADFEALVRHFQPLPAATQPPLTAAEAGRLLVAALVDEKLGIANAVGSLVSWLGDAARFGDDWSQAVARFLQLARHELL